MSETAVELEDTEEEEEEELFEDDDFQINNGRN